MTDSARHAADSLIDILKRENAALARCDYKAAAALVAGKQAAIRGLEGAALSPDGISRDVAADLLALAGQNKQSLERAIAVQSRIIRIVAEACAPPERRYGQSGRPAHRLGAAVAVSIQA